MELWSIIIPEEATNLVLNPSLEVDTTGYTATPGSTIIRASGISYFGFCSLKVTPGGPDDGAYYTNNSSFILTSGQQYHISFYMLASGGLDYSIFITTNVGPLPLQQYDFVSESGWRRYDFDYTETETAQRRLYFMTDEDTLTGTEPFYIDGVSLIQGQDYESTYIDGDQPGCEWNGEEHLSTSFRSGQYRQAGRVVNFQDLALNFQSMTGVGMMPIEHFTQEYGLSDGALYRGSKVKPRVFQLTAYIEPSTIRTLHVDRADIIDAIKLNLVGTQQELLLKYQIPGEAETEARYIKALYEEGMGFQTVTPYLDTLPLRFLSTDPYFYAENQLTSTLMSSAEAASGIISQRDRNGSWSTLNATFNDYVAAIAYDQRRGYYIFGGAFTLPQVALSKYTVATGAYSTLGGMVPDNGQVTDIVIDETNGDVYVTGDFTSFGGIARTRGIARYNRVANTWQAVGSGLANGFAYTLAFGNDITLYVGGSFTAASGVSNTPYIFQYNPTTNIVSAMGTGMNSDVTDITIGPDGLPYVTGSFTTSNGVTTRGLTRWTGSTFEAYGGLTGNINGIQLAFGLDGALYWGFSGTQINGVTYNYIAKYNGTQWQSLGTGLNSTPNRNAMSIRKDGTLIVGGFFSTAGGLTLPSSAAIWNGSQWFPLGIKAGNARVVYVNPANGDITIGWSTNVTTLKESVTTITNDASADTYPTILISLPIDQPAATLYFLKNYTTGDTIYFNTALILNPGEEMTLELRPNEKNFTSNFQGRIVSKILPGSNTGQWRLLPETNKISFFANVTNVSVKFLWTPKFIGIDGGN